MSNAVYWTSADVIELTGCGKGKAASVIRLVNQRLRQKGFITFRDRAPREYIIKALGIKCD